MKDTPMPELKPCPFCGGKPRLDIGLMEFVDAEVTCECGGNSGNHPSSAEAIAAWNTRAPSVRVAAKVLLEACPNPLFDMLKPVLMGEVIEATTVLDEDDNEVTHHRRVSWTAMKETLALALRALASDTAEG